MNDHDKPKDWCGVEESMESGAKVACLLAALTVALVAAFAGYSLLKLFFTGDA